MLDYLGDLALIVIVLLFLIWIGAALWNVTGTGDAWDKVGGGPWEFDHSSGDGPKETESEREADLQSLLKARDDRRSARGLFPRPDPLPDRHSDPELEAEIRAHVRARNARRTRAGKAPLDEDAEVLRLMSGR